jgi:2-oxo-4-hydroxy-4-carboxy-5-ureidoimidazoline decarboxylase
MDLTPLKIKASTSTKEAFVEAYDGIYEHSAWIALGAWALRDGNNLDSVGGLHREMMNTIEQASEAGKMTLICAHPDLAGKLAVNGELTAESRSEQAGAGLDQCTSEEFEEFQSLNSRYKETFGFPYIIAVKGHDRQSILANFRARINNDRMTEFETALTEINKIALFRLADHAE